MLEAHRRAFLHVAQARACWIGVREPNPMADRWIAGGTCVPKSEACKAKTADNPTFPYAGLVVDPTTRSEAFQRATLPRAMEKWGEFLKVGRPPAGFSIVEEGPERGLVRFRGRRIMADYDLMALLKSNAAGERLYTDKSEIPDLIRRVVPAVNQALGIDMVQHGPEFDPGFKYLGAAPREWVLWFGPGRRVERHESSMPPKFAYH